VISAFDGKPRAQKWKDAFKDSYGVGFDTMKRTLKSVPDEILLMLNRRASAKRLVGWQKKKRIDRANNIIHCADQAISLWEQSPGTRFAAGSRRVERKRKKAEQQTVAIDRLSTLVNKPL
jgi:hypothetical protein